MVYHSVAWRETFGKGLDATAVDPRRANRCDQYNLATALRIVRAMETSAARGSVFAEIKLKNRFYLLVDALYSRAGKRVLQPLVMLAYMVKCIVALGPFQADGAEAVSISNFGNESHSVDRLAALAPDTSLLRLSLRRGHMFGHRQLRSAFLLLAAARRVWPFLSALVRKHSFMPSARIASTLAFYIRFVQLFTDHPRLSAAVIASNYSPEAVGMAAAAHRMGRRVIYINHAPVPANGALVPPVLADCAIFYGEAVRETYEARSRCIAEVAVIGQPWPARPMKWGPELRTIGIFLTALTRAEVVAELVSAIRVTQPCARILIRNHPVALLRSSFSNLESQDGKLEVTIGNPLDEEIAACDLIICGNSGVAMNALSAGRPVAYMDVLDGLRFDYNGFVENGLVCHIKTWTCHIFSELRAFYDNAAWQKVMKSYDASYGADVEVLNQTAAKVVARYLTPIRRRGPAAFRVPTRVSPVVPAPL